ncbi:hypothetical protein GUITHDRAFT_153237 [Guillardia theta CCMP2712]|uniref:Secreted protein n=1 Tax=Guillardia theta (strain CCMP2712) TaxID=905079 RepID=L1J6F1_GUITC|nr:hypothetical protein GUITHDRAFT_153237 [Guillardia theta CCMP2712]EKX43665.1 hypothetical protein GUITHDRAFT_153237 [Guillardia theta CCMP2712]|eukprot:XP_005830645.1 hypothetical protein GUITHDRAFT_153237 [Guillardia theta CCMP2712]
MGAPISQHMILSFHMLLYLQMSINCNHKAFTRDRKICPLTYLWLTLVLPMPSTASCDHRVRDSPALNHSALFDRMLCESQP